MAETKTGQIDAKTASEWRQSCLDDLFFLCSFVFHHGKKREYRDLNQIHLELCDFLDDKRFLQKLVLMFRDGLKSSMARAKVIQWFLRKLAAEEEGKAFYYSGVFELAQDQLGRIVKEIVENDLLQALFKDVIPRKKSDFDYCAVTEGKIRFHKAEIDIGSPDKALAGHHYDLGINDNLMNEVNTRSDKMRKTIVKDWQHQESMLAERAEEVVFETPWFPDDVSGIILDPDALFDYRKLWRRPCHRFISETGYAVFSCPAAKGEGRIGIPVFPEKVDAEYLERKRRKQGPAIYGAMYDLQPVSEQEAVYRPSWIRHYTELPYPFYRTLTIDCAGTKGRESSPSAISIGDWDPDGRLHIVYAEKRKVSHMERYYWFLNLLESCFEEKRPVMGVGIEKEKYGDAMDSMLRAFKIDEKYKFVLNLVPIEKSRPDRLASMQSEYELGKILSKPGLEDYEKEVRSYYRDKVMGVDILETIYLHSKIKMIPKKAEMARPAVKTAEEDFVRQIKRDRMRGIYPSGQFISRSF